MLGVVPGTMRGLAGQDAAVSTVLHDERIVPLDEVIRQELPNIAAFEKTGEEQADVDKLFEAIK